MPAPDVTPEQGETELTRFETEGRSLERVEAVSSLDGRYRRVTERLAPYFSEKALISHRIEVEAKYIVALSEAEVVRPLTEEEITLLGELSDISTGEANTVKAIEVKGALGYDKTDHDVKAVEYFIREKLQDTSLEDIAPMVHFALTSEDINNMSYALMMSRATEEVIIPEMEKIIDEFNKIAEAQIGTEMLARTHGQPATPTTFGKEMAVFASRLAHQVEQLKTRPIKAKFSGATGTFSAHHLAYPNVDWPAFSAAFIESVNGDRSIELEANPVTTQIEPHDTYAEMFDNYKRFNNVLIDASVDIWDYIKDNLIKQTPKDAESQTNVTGSSTMPQKINPIKFENGEGNLDRANWEFMFLSNRLPKSRRQRDLSDSTVERTIGEAISRTLVAYDSIQKGFGKISIDSEAIRAELAAHPEVLTEGVQTVMRAQGVPDAYERLKAFSQGNDITGESLREFIRQQDLDSDIEIQLLELEPKDYIGLAVHITRDHLAREAERTG